MQGDTEDTAPEQALIPEHALIEDLRVRLDKARRIAVLSGAGISAESGVPTFRGSGGLWRSHRAVDLATPEAFKRDPKLVWEFYNYRREVLSELAPNPAHIALAGLAGKLKDKDGLTIITQNVDGLHQRAGSRELLELHGNIWRVRCTECAVVTENHDVPIEILPFCRQQSRHGQCKGLLRPDIVWFGEMLPSGIFEQACSVAAEADIMLIIGTSGVVQPAASLAEYAKTNGAYTVEINPEKTPISGVMDKSITARAAELLPLII